MTTLKKLTAITLGIGVLFQGVTCTAHAAQMPASSVKESQFVTGVYGTNENGGQIVLALYNTGKKDIAFIRDGDVTYYGTYTITPDELTGGTNVQHFDVSGVTFTYFEVDKGRYIMTDDGVVYVLDDLSSYEVEQLR